ncbi:MAG: asparagine synthase C-terminal domain-containing protein [Sandaracinaceae bacterium]|nr:asparagine synthase C-terminal domain-containing protein [Sandaracinaceae bacterium]
MSLDALAEYLALGFVGSPRSILDGVRKVRPGTLLVFDDPALEPRETVYWNAVGVGAARRRQSPGVSELVEDEHVLEALRSSVRDMMVADVPLGAFLSGGVDSSLVVALMTESRPPREIRTFTIGFRERAFDESAYAHEVARLLGVENTMHVLSPSDVLAELDSLCDVIDEPMADFSILPAIAVSKVARRHVTVALTGDGADELFGGYRYYVGARWFDLVGSSPPRARRALAAVGQLPLPGRSGRALRRIGAPDTAAYFGKSGFYRGATAESESATRFMGGTPGHVRAARWIRECTAQGVATPTEAGMLWDITCTLPDAWLAKVDRASMAVGLETRAPFLATSVVETALRLPPSQRAGLWGRKPVLRRLLRRFLPARLVDRPKQGFTVPMRRWLAGELREELRDRLARTTCGAVGSSTQRQCRPCFRSTTGAAATTRRSSGHSCSSTAGWTACRSMGLLANQGRLPVNACARQDDSRREQDYGGSLHG